MENYERSYWKMNDSRKQDLEMFVDGSISKDPKTIVNAFNDYFVDVGPQLASRIIIAMSTPVANSGGGGLGPPP